MARSSTVLVVQHVDWEGPHRISDALQRAGLSIDLRRPLSGDELPAADELAAAVFMGGPMNVDQIDQFPELQIEREWLIAALSIDLPLLGVCLGAQLIARAAGATVRPGLRPEIGWARVDVTDPNDPVIGGLAPAAQVLHWHGDIFDLPNGARPLATSEQTALQAFRLRSAWGVLFHAEADRELIDHWLDQPSMRSEAEQMLGSDAVEQLRTDAKRNEKVLIEASNAGFERFAALAAERAAAT
ncbi:MAG: type 1 glutamine amidotransferase [Solirubrobacterales bacterium]